MWPDGDLDILNWVEDALLVLMAREWMDNDDDDGRERGGKGKRGNISNARKPVYFPCTSTRNFLIYK